MTMQADYVDDDLEDDGGNYNLDYGDDDDDGGGFGGGGGGGDEFDGIQPLDSGSMSISASRGGGGNAEASAYAYSAIIARETEVSFKAFIDWMRSNRPDDKMCRNVISGLMDLARLEFKSPAVLRQLRFEQEEAKAKYWEKRLGKDRLEEKDKAEEELRVWGNANLVQIDIRHRRIRDGLGAVYPERPRWYTAQRKQDEAERRASHLDTVAYEYFRCRIEQFNIQREEAEDRALQNPKTDYSNLIKRINSGEVNPAEVVSSAPWSMSKAIELCMQNPGEKNPYWAHLERMQGGVAVAMQGRRRRRPRGGDDGGDEG